ncbi:hypothetical protein ACIBEA_30075 [Streptomyces sp. NPDC051555]|uniref:hypothetical protein n=1 Tax=Streptomyces sp. NPDC051555 TaxID=3365657 RepID=UPI003789D74B
MSWLLWGLATWLICDFILAALWSAHRRRENRVRRDAEARRVARNRADFNKIVAAEYGIPHQTRRTEEDQ